MAATVNRDLYQELRLALVFNGGVSLAVWMGGAAKEIDRFRRALSSASADATRLGAYRELCDLLRTVVMTDVIAGASAGGINGAFLGYVVANGKSLECAGPNAVRDLWQNLGSMKDLLAADGVVESVLLTDKILFAGCAKVFDEFKNADADVSEDVSTWVRLAITATDTHGYQVAAPVTASTDIEVSGVDHRLLFRFRRIVAPDRVLLGSDLVTAIRAEVPGAPNDGWPFPKSVTKRDLRDPKDGTTGNAEAAALLARAARTTSSFPIAFYPSELPLNYTAEQKVADSEPGGRLTATPAMAEVLQAPNTATPLLPDGAPADGARCEDPVRALRNRRRCVGQLAVRGGHARDRENAERPRRSPRPHLPRRHTRALARSPDAADPAESCQLAQEIARNAVRPRVCERSGADPRRLRTAAQPPERRAAAAHLRADRSLRPR